MARLAPLALLLTAALAAVLAGPPGSVGEADGSLYADVAACAGSEAWRSPPCLRSSPTSAWLPTLVLGRTARLLGGAGAAPRVLRGFGAALALACLLLTFLLASAPGRSAPGLVASLLLLLCTPLLDRARAGGVEIWLFAELLALAWLLRRPMEGLLATLGAAFLATAACATHPYALVVLPLLLFCRVPQTLPHGPARVGGRLWLGWLDGPTLAAAIGGLALVGAIWTPDASAILWSRLVGLYRMDHAPFRVAAQTWIQGERLHSPPLAATLDTLVFTTPLPLLLAGLAGVGVRLGRRDEDSAPSHAALLLLLFGWLLVVALQGSPVADGADHRLVLLGLLAPAVGPGLRGIQSLVAQAWPRFARVGVPWVLSLSALPAGARAVEGLPPGSGLAPSGPALVARGLSPLPAPRLDPSVLTTLAGLPAGSRVACSPWSLPCAQSILPGLAAVGLGAPAMIASRPFDAEVVIIPQDATYATPPVLLHDLRGANRLIADLPGTAPMRFALRWLRLRPKPPARGSGGAAGAPRRGPPP